MLRLKNQSLLALCLFITIVSAQAAPSDTISGYIGGTSNQVNRDVGDVPGNRWAGDLDFDYHSNQADRVERRFSFGARTNDESLTMYSLQEAYVARKGIFKSWDSINKSGDNFKFGRQILDWSTIDASWGFGKVNNRRNFDGFEPGQEGLIGIGYENYSSNGWNWRVFGSAIYVPEMNPSLDINKSDGTITTRHAWANPPSATTDLEGRETQVRYNVDYPTISEVVYRPSVGMGLGWQSKHWSVDGFFIRKPENQLSTKVRVQLVTDPSDFHVDASVKPQIFYHDVFGGNLKWHNKDVSMYVSGIGIRPNTFPDGDSNATQFTELKTEKRREAYGGGGISKINDKYGMGVNYVARLSPFDRERDSLATDPRWNQAVNVFLSRTFAKKYNLSGDLKYDTLTTDRLMMVRAGYKVSKELLMNVGVNIIGTPSSGKSFWSPYTNNDSVYGMLRYIF